MGFYRTEQVELDRLRAEVERMTGSVETLRELRELDRVLIERLKTALHNARSQLEADLIRMAETTISKALGEQRKDGPTCV